MTLSAFMAVCLNFEVLLKRNWNLQALEKVPHLFISKGKHHQWQNELSEFIPIHCFQYQMYLHFISSILEKTVTCSDSVFFIWAVLCTIVISLKLSLCFWSRKDLSLVRLWLWWFFLNCNIMLIRLSDPASFCFSSNLSYFCVYRHEAIHWNDSI